MSSEALRFYDDITEANNVSPLTPELWVMEGLRLWRTQSVAPRLVNRQYEDVFSGPGDLAKVYKTKGFEATRKFRNEAFVNQDIDATQKYIRLNQHITVSFLLDEADMSKAFPTVRDQYLVNAMEAIITGLENVVVGETYNFLARSAGKVNLAQNATDAEILKLRKMFQLSKMPLNSRNMITNPSTEALLLGVDRFVDADKIGADTAFQALANGYLGRLRGFNAFASLGNLSIEGTTDTIPACELTANYPVGTKTLGVDGVTGTVAAGAWCTIEGDDLPRQIVSRTNTSPGGDLLTITLATGITSPVLNNADVTIYVPAAVNHPDGGSGVYPEQYAGAIKIDGFTLPPIVGQGVTFGTSAVAYSILKFDSIASTITLNRPLDGTLADGVAVCLIPPGNYNLALHPEAIALVNRPLKPVEGVRSFYAEFDGLALRATITYDSTFGRWRVTIDTLAGVTTVDTDMGAVFVS